MSLPRKSLASFQSLSLFLAVMLGLAGIRPLRAEDVKPARTDDVKPALSESPLAVLDKPAPGNVRDLLVIQEQVKRVLAKVMPATVGIRIGMSSGSGVIISEDGYVLTAGHVCSEPNRDVTLILPDGRFLKGKTLGVNRGIDSGLIKISDQGKWPFAAMGDSGKLKKGQWCLSLGHPGGYKPGRTPVVRLGRVLDRSDSTLRTDCTLVGGDSGGPLFDLQGKVIGIHSRIGLPITANIHVPVDTYRDTWDRLAKGEAWGGRLGRRDTTEEPDLGFRVDSEGKACKIINVSPDSPAAKAGLKPDDIVTKIADQKVSSRDELGAQVRKHKPGDEVTLEVMRGKDTLTFKLVVGKRGR
jgi:serine protease Do